MLPVLSRKVWCLHLQIYSTLTATLHLEAVTPASTSKLSFPRPALDCCRAVSPKHQGQQHTIGEVRCQVRPENSAPTRALLAHYPALPASSLRITPSVLFTESVANKPTEPAPPRARVKCRLLHNPELPT